jgi:hypothetical protein
MRPEKLKNTVHQFISPSRDQRSADFNTVLL